MCLSIPPKFSVANAIGKLKGESAILIHRRPSGRPRIWQGIILCTWLLRKLNWLERRSSPRAHQQPGRSWAAQNAITVTGAGRKTNQV